MSVDETLYAGDYLRLKRIDRWEYVERVNANGAVAIVAVTAADEILLVEQMRWPVGARVLELPAGLVGDIVHAEHETLAVAAARELKEETGYRAARFEYLAGGPPSAGLARETISLLRAFDLERIDAGGGDASEDITPHAVKRADVDAWLARREAEGVRVDPKIFAGLYLLNR